MHHSLEIYIFLYTCESANVGRKSCKTSKKNMNGTFMVYNIIKIDFLQKYCECKKYNLQDQVQAMTPEVHTVFSMFQDSSFAQIATLLVELQLYFYFKHSFNKTSLNGNWQFELQIASLLKIVKMKENNKMRR